MVVLNRLLVCAVLTPCFMGCQVCNPSLKKACAEACGQEYHVNAPAQKVIVHRDTSDGKPCDDVPAPNALREPCKPESRAPQQPSQAPQQQPAMAPQGYAAAPQGQMGAPSQMGIAPLIGGGLVAIPSLPTSLAFTLSFDIIKIPIPIPRLRTLDVPPETRLSYVQVGGANAAAAPMLPAMAPPVMPAGYAPQAPEQQECIRPEQLAAAIALVKQQQQQQSGTPNNNTPTNSTAAATARAEEELTKRERQLDALERKLDDAAKRYDRLQKDNAPPPPPPNDDASWRPRNER